PATPPTLPSFPTRPSSDLAQPDIIAFDIPTSDPNYNPATGAFTITPNKLFIYNPVFINGYTQPGSTPNDIPLVGRLPFPGESAGPGKVFQGGRVYGDDAVLQLQVAGRL